MIESTEFFSWEGSGYKPLVYSGNWQVAILNWEPSADWNAINELERHTQSDEVFVLIQGKGILVVLENDGLNLIDAIPGRIYNVSASTWHTVVGSLDSKWIIVENRDTHLNDFELRMMDASERSEFISQMGLSVNK